MRDRIFAAVMSALFIGLMVWCPGLFTLEKAGVVTLPENMNQVSPVKTHENGRPLADVLNAFEEGKAEIENIPAFIFC